MSARCIATVCALLLSLPSLAADKPEKWFEIRSPNFLIVTNAGEKQGRRTAEEFELFRAAIHSVIPAIKLDPGQPVIVVAVKDEKSLKKLLPAYWETKGRVHPAGIFLAGPEKHYAAVRLDAEGETRFHVLYHEYVHLLVNVNFEWFPLWLNEGLAEFYATAVLQGFQVGLGRPSEGHLYLLKENKLLPIEELLRVDHSSPHYNEANKTSIFYAQSWALTHYLLVGDRGVHFKQLDQYLIELRKGATERQAAEVAFGDLKKFDKTIGNYISRSSYYYLPTKPPADIDEKTFPARELTPAEAASVAGDFYVRTRRPVEARAALEQAMSLDPTLAAPRESMGLLCQIEGKLEEALQWFDQAVRLDSKSYLAHYYHAMMSSRGGLNADGMEAAEKALLRTVELNPRFAPAYSTLASLYAVRNEKLPEALKFAKKAVELEPGNLFHHLNLGNVLMRMDRVAEAETVGKRMLATARTNEERMAAQAYLQNLSSYRDYVVKKKRMDEERARYEAEMRKQAEVERVRTETPPSTGQSTAPVAKGGGTVEPRGRVTADGEGRVAAVTCQGPVMDLTLEYLGDSFVLHSENYFKVEYLTVRWKAPANFDPCQHLKGRQVKVEYYVAVGKPFAGELVSLEVVR
jgi:tetratricopeptide (TPR) repeat protein